MKKYIITAILLLATIVSTYSQESDVTELKLEEEPTNFHNFIRSNWFVGAAVGKAWKVGNLEGLNLTSTPIYELSVGKWVLPYIAFRAQLNSSAIKGTSTLANSFTNGDPDGNLSGHRLVHHYDVMFSVMNIVDGYYKDDRFYDLKPFVGLGFVWCYDDDTSYSKDNPIFGVVNRFNVASSMHIDLEFRFSPANAGHYGVVEDGLQRERIYPLTLSLGFTYRFKPRGWRVTAPYADYPTLKVFEHNYYIPAEKEYIVQKEVVKEIVRDTVEVGSAVREDHIVPSIVFFEIDKYNITRRNRVRLGMAADIINNIPSESDAIFTITGYADVQTATKDHNWTLSKNRAEAVYYVLVNEFGVDKRRLKIDYEGGVDYMYYDDNTLSRCVIIQ